MDAYKIGQNFTTVAPYWWNFILMKTVENKVSPVRMFRTGETYPYWLSRREIRILAD